MEDVSLIILDSPCVSLHSAFAIQNRKTNLTTPLLHTLMYQIKLQLQPRSPIQIWNLKSHVTPFISSNLARKSIPQTSTGRCEMHVSLTWRSSESLRSRTCSKIQMVMRLRFLLHGSPPNRYGKKSFRVPDLRMHQGLQLSRAHHSRFRSLRSIGHHVARPTLRRERSSKPMRSPPASLKPVSPSDMM